MFKGSPADSSGDISLVEILQIEGSNPGRFEIIILSSTHNLFWGRHCYSQFVIITVTVRLSVHHKSCVFYNGWSGGAIGLGELPVSGRPSNLGNSRARAYCTCSRCGWWLF